ncbi:MAG: STAS domain-containing protein [Kiritimatiellae bacterium]|nr:STAS domain-containing protein [Kiritimatiellia bacterium]
MDSHLFDILIEEQGDVKIACVNGPVDVSNIDIFSEKVGALCRGTSNKTVLDLSGMNYINSRGMGLMIEFSRQAALGGGRFVVCSPRPVILKNIELLRLDAVVEIFETRTDAVAALS